MPAIQPGIQQVRPQTRREFMDKLYVPTDPQYGNPNITFSDPFKAGQPEFNRAYETKFTELDNKKFSIGIKDHSEAIQYYFDNVLKLTVYQNNDTVLVPVIYGTPEKWKSVQRDGYYRDGAIKIMPPLIMYKKTSVIQNRTLGNKVDGNAASNVQLFEKAFSRRNVYDNLSTAFFLHGLHPEAINSVIPGGWSIAVEMTFYLFFPKYIISSM